ncbi:MAG: hypothetical protein J7604_22735 [Sporocytophaga sp.]|uniref:hypothetical protein n=1 Tax=Sporocytophaga sp. TaxID=2231183 RepID=UPI001B277F84|nr:hypothetical protein [Sporocytophaga sp.]MBO9703049.1 hypothetical protein [Sporocytophaga sp.]
MIRIIIYLAFLLSINTVFAKEFVDKTDYSKSDMNVSPTNNLGEEYQNFALVQNTISDPASRTFFVNKAFGVVQLYYPLTSNTVPTNGTAEVTVDLTYTVEENNVLVDRHKISVLKIDMSAAHFAPIALERLENALKISGRITNVNIPATGFEDIKLQFRVETEVFENMSYSQAVTGILKDDQFVNTEGSLLVSWNALNNAESYELEWTYISNQDPENINNTLPLAQIQLRDNLLFRTNSSRVELKSNSFKIPLIYEKGLIFYRVRPIGRNIANGGLVTVKGKWTLEENSTSVAGISTDHYYEFSGLEQSMNWQSSVSFAEEGKSKVVLSYHDGSSRNRQAVTRVNTDERAIVGETFYDYNGRPAIQILPVPDKGANNLYYHPQFNKIEDENGAPLPVTKSSYDIATEGAGCDVDSPTLDEGSGASHYYSPSNSFETSGNKGINIINKGLIPDAKKYPYTQTKYTNDNTGRIAAQSGVGDAHQIKSGHETKYLYGTPDQEELTRLFGTQVGNNAHYKKNVVVDPNGQVSVSYLDMDGKVIATALAGGSPENVKGLEGPKGRHINSQLLSTISNILSEDKRSKSYLKKLVVSENNTSYVFSYNFSAKPYIIKCTNKSENAVQDINLSAVLDAEIELQSCGERIFLQPLSSTYQFGNGAIQTGNTTITKVLNAGEYTLTKKIKINEAKLNDYLSQYLSNSAYTCVIPVGDYIKDSIDIADLSGCGYSCETCQNNVETLITNIDSRRDGVTTPKLTESEKEGMRSKCYDLCRSNIACVSALNGMLADLSIGGQYAEIREKNLESPKAPSIQSDDFVNKGDITESEYDVPLNNDPEGNMMGTPITDINVSKFKLSVFNPDNILSVVPITLTDGTKISRADWHKPIRIIIDGYPNAEADYNQSIFKDEVNLNTAEYEETNYYGTDGKLVYAKVIKSGNTYFPEFIPDGASALVTVNEEIGEYKIPVKYLKDIAIFENYWKPHFANYLVVYHPEYKYFVECTGQNTINEFEYKLVTSENISDDTNHQFVNSDGTVSIVDNDPLFAGNAILKKHFKLLFNNYKVVGGNTSLSMVQVANLGVGCPVSTVTCPGPSCPSNLMTTGAAWNMFKSLYLTERQKVLRSLATAKAIEGGYYNGCIGDPDFTSTDEASPFFQFREYTSSRIETQRNCSGWWVWRNCTESQVEVKDTYYSIPYFDSKQTCFVWRSRFYGDRIRKFYQKVYPLGAELQQGRCIRKVHDPETNTDVDMVVNCQEDEELYINQINDAVARQRYEDCGLCPIASDIQDFIIQAQRKKILKNTSPIVVACPPSTSLLMLGGTLIREFKIGSTIPAIRWTGTYDEATRILTGELSSSADNTFTPPTKTIKITLNFSTLPSGMVVDFNKLKICCLNPTDATHFKMTVYYTGYYKTSDNSLLASIDRIAPELQSGYQKASFEINGEVENTSLTPCIIAPNCQVTGASKNIVGFLNMLNKQVINDKTAQLVSSTDVNLSSSAMIKYYEYPLRKLLNINALDANGDPAITLTSIAPKWKSSVNANGILMGELTYSTSNKVSINIRKTGSASTALDFNTVNYFTNIQPVTDVSSCTGNECSLNLFTADAVTVDSNNNKIYTKVEIEVPNYTMTVCKKAVQGSN